MRALHVGGVAPSSCTARRGAAAAWVKHATGFHHDTNLARAHEVSVKPGGRSPHPDYQVLQRGPPPSATVWLSACSAEGRGRGQVGDGEETLIPYSSWLPNLGFMLAPTPTVDLPRSIGLWQRGHHVRINPTALDSALAGRSWSGRTGKSRLWISTPVAADGPILAESDPSAS
jgi:hypothetical protein